jgi:hypothetical protein
MRVFTAITFLCCSLVSFAQDGTWTWMKGDSIANTSGSYGVKGVGAITNLPPARSGAFEWTDSLGNFWIYGGADISGNDFSDLWMYAPATNAWTWIAGDSAKNLPGHYGTQGVFDPANHPASKSHGTCWKDSYDHFWLFSGHGNSANDIWQYDPVLNQWAWMKGDTTAAGGYPHFGIKGSAAPANTPATLTESCSNWVDDKGAFWLYGGESFLGTWGNLWVYDPVDNDWTWISGDSAVSDLPVHGQQGIADTANKPGSRIVSTAWQDDAGNFWLFGGESNGLTYNDLWKFDVLTGLWTWVSGSSLPMQDGIYGAQCAESSGSIPGSRSRISCTWVDDCGNFWLFGGSVSGERFNDLWKYDPVQNRWSWIAGDTTGNISSGQQDVYGVIGVPALANKPDVRDGFSTFKRFNELWVFGGLSGPSSAHNDLWRYIPDSDCTDCIAVSSVPEKAENLLFTLSPNPAGELITIGSEKAFSAVQVSLVNMLGQDVYSATAAIGPGSLKTISTGQLENGVYLVRICTNDAVFTRQIIIRH